MSSVEVLFINGMIYTIALLFFVRKYKFSVGVIVWTLYTVSAWASFLFIQQPGYASSVHASEQTIMPCLYLFSIVFISVYPMMKLYTIAEINFFNKKLLRWIIIACTVIQVVFVVVDFPTMIRVAFSPANLLSDLRSTIYGDGGLSLVTRNAWLNRFSLLFSGMRIIATGLSIITFISYKDERKLINIFAAVTLLNNLRLILISVGRGELVFVSLLYVSIIYLMRDWISERGKKRIITALIPIGIVGATFFWAITVSRFGSKAGFFMYKYLGEPMNNFNGILFPNIQGTTNGRAYFSVIFKYLFGEADVVTANEKWELIQSRTGIRGDIFYTYVGGMVIEFGKIAPFFIAILLNRFTVKLTKLNEFYFGDLVVLIFFINFFVRGIFIFPTQSFEGLFMIIYSVLLYFVFRIKKGNNGSLVYVLPRRKRTRD